MKLSSAADQALPTVGLYRLALAAYPRPVSDQDVKSMANHVTTYEEKSQMSLRSKSITTLVLFLALSGMALLALNSFPSVQAGPSIPSSVSENTTTNLARIVVLDTSSAPSQTWTQDTRADWEAGTLEFLDSAATPSSLQLAQQHFTAPTSIIPPEHLASWQEKPDIAVDSVGNAYAVWTDDRDGNRNIYFAYRPAGGAWGNNVRVNDDTGTMPQNAPAIAVDNNGNAYAVWEDWRDNNGDIYSAYRPAGSTWGINTKVNDGTGATQQAEQKAPDITVDDAGNAYAVWQDKRNDRGDIYFSYRPSGGTWQANVRINDDAPIVSQAISDITMNQEPTPRPIPRLGEQYDPAIAVDKNRNAYAIWAENRNENCNIYSAVRSAGGAWGANIKVNDDVGTMWHSSSEITVDDNGNIYAVWEDERNSDSNIYFANRLANNGWGTNVQIGSATATTYQYAPAIAADNNGNAYTIWLDNRDGNKGIYFAVRSSSGTWKDNIKLSDYATDYIDRIAPAITVDGNGAAYIVWADYSKSSSYDMDIYFARSAQEYHSLGTYTSPVFDTRMITAAWESLTHISTVPTGTTLTFETRSLPSSNDPLSSNWSAWQPALPVSQTLQINSPRGRYFQYRVTFSTTLATTTPILDQVQITYRWAGPPSAPHLSVPCGVTNQTTPTLRGSAAEGSIVHLYVDGTEVATQTIGPGTLSFGAFAFSPHLAPGPHTITATADNQNGAGPASLPLHLTVDPTLAYDPINVRAGEWSGDSWLLGIPRDADGCANPTNGWRVWPRPNQPFQVRVLVSYTTSATVTVTVGTQTITLTEQGNTGLFTGIFNPPIQTGEFIIQVNADGNTTTVTGGPILIDPDGVVYEATGTISDTIAGVTVTCYYSDTYRGQWITWDAWTYQQINPQVTSDDGYYSFYTPRGTYRVVAEKAGYPTYTSPNLVVVSTPVRHNIPLGWRRVYLPLIIRS